MWLFNPEVPVGFSKKLRRMWTGPYRVTSIGPNHTYRLQNCETLELISYLSARRLKPVVGSQGSPIQRMMNENQPGQTQVRSPQPSQSNTPLTSGLRTSTGASSNVPRAGPQQTTGEYLRQDAGSKDSNNAPSSCKDKSQVRCRQPNLKNSSHQAGSNTSTGPSSNVPRASSKQVRQKVANNNRPCKEVRQQPKGSKTKQSKSARKPTGKQPASTRPRVIKVHQVSKTNGKVHFKVEYEGMTRREWVAGTSRTDY